jgi:hypothetical protein
MNACYFAVNTWMMLIPDLIVNLETRVFSDEEAYDVDVFGHEVNFTFVSEPFYEESAIDQMVCFVINNCGQVEKYVEYVLITILCCVVFYFSHAHMLIL